ncbi:MAG: methionyl-tRNA formyltransferase [Monoraphidium minutum]|nr:MAG: methionyl-tRNA formyltransferase [Monoraphidium minutum]
MALASRHLQRCLRARPFLRAPRAGASGRRLACAAAPEKQRLVFLGTPEVAAIVLEELLTAAKAPDASFEVAVVVSQPGKPKGRGNKAVPVPSPVEQLARAAGVPDDRILCPKTARDPAFLEALSALRPDLCVTAAYGNMLPAAFLSIPRRGTLNIHPSLLPRYRGAAPVQRALQDGVAETGVSVAFTVLACDAGPVLEQRAAAPGADEAAPALLERLFRLGARLLVARLGDVWSGAAAGAAAPQDEAAATHAPKLSKEEAAMDFSSKSAQELHNQVRAFAPWPGTVADFIIAPAAAEDGGVGGVGGGAPAEGERLQIKILTTRVADASELPPGAAAARRVAWAPPGRMLVPCGGGGALEVLALQQPAKKAVAARDFANGLKGRQVYVASPAAAAAAAPAAEGAAAAGAVAGSGAAR